MIHSILGLDSKVIEEFSKRRDLIGLAYDWMRWPDYNLIDKLRHHLPEYHSIQPPEKPKVLLRGIRYIRDTAEDFGIAVKLTNKQSNVMGLPHWSKIRENYDYRYKIVNPISFTTSESTALGFAKTGDHGFVLEVNPDTIPFENLLWYSGELYYAMVMSYKNKRSVMSSLLKEYTVIPGNRGIDIKFQCVNVNNLKGAGKIMGFA